MYQPAVAKKVVVCFRFVSGKPLIDANTVPRFEFRFDAFRGRSFAEQLRAKIPMFPALLLVHSRQVKSPCPTFDFSAEKEPSCLFRKIFYNW